MDCLLEFHCVRQFITVTVLMAFFMKRNCFCLIHFHKIFGLKWKVTYPFSKSHFIYFVVKVFNFMIGSMAVYFDQFLVVRSPCSSA